MASADQIRAWVEVAKKKNYYEILRIFPNADDGQIKDAFHKFALRFHPDQLVEDGDDVVAAGAELFKRGVEAYKVLARADWRARYDEGLLHGKLRFIPGETEKPPPPPATRTLEEIAATPRAKEFAKRADRLISVGKLEDARVALVTALQDDYNNEELKERLDVLYEALALEPL
jgi:curved DNA-binding protein CbpA